MIPVSRPVNKNGNLVVFVLADLTGLRAWVDYVPVVYVTGRPDRYDENGAIEVETLADTTGLIAWVDYIPVVEGSEDVTLQWRTDAGGYIPVVEEA
jgi:hypothetical protein